MPITLLSKVVRNNTANNQGNPMAQSLTDAYTAQVLAIHAAMANLQEFVDTLPAPEDESGDLPKSINWGLVSVLAAFAKELGDAAEIIDGL